MDLYKKLDRIAGLRNLSFTIKLLNNVQGAHKGNRESFSNVFYIQKY